MKNNMRPIHNEPGLVRDEKSRAVINTNDAEYQLILEKRANARRIDGLESQVEELREMIRALTR